MNLKKYGIREKCLETLIDLVIINRDKYCNYLSEIRKYPVSPLFTFACRDEKQIQKILLSLNIHNIIRYDMKPEVYTFRVFNCKGVSETYEIPRKENERKAIVRLFEEIGSGIF